MHAYCALQALNAAQYGWSDAQVQERLAKAAVHMEFVCLLYRKQLEGGRHFLHEHPDTCHQLETPMHPRYPGA